MAKWYGHSNPGGFVTMRRFAKVSPIYWTLFIGFAIFAIEFTAISKTLGLEIKNWSVTKVQGDAPVAPPRTMVLRGPSPETERIAALFASIGSFDVFVAPLDDRIAGTGEKVELENSESCRSEAQELSPSSVKIECIHRAQPEPLPGCRLGIDLRGAPESGGSAQRAWIYAVLDHGEPCPFFDQLAKPSSSLLFPDKPLRPFTGSRLVAELASPTPRSILRAIGVEPNKIGH
jgi:hypothetical protein